MNDTPEATSTLNTEGSDFAVPAGYEIAEEDRALAAEILSRDPVASTGGPVRVFGNPKLPEKLKATTLAPNLRDPILQQLANCPPDRREDLEHQLVMEAGYGIQAALRMRSGAGPDASPYHSELFLIEGELADAEAKVWQAEQDLADVISYDPTTGKAIERLQGQIRREKEAERNRLLHRVSQIADGGLERQLRLKKALSNTIAAEKTAAARKSEEAEAQALATELQRKRRIEERAAIIARVRPS